MAQTIYTNSLADCTAFAALFHNTCSSGSEAANVAVLAGEEVDCSATGPNCVDSGTREENEKCKYTRKLCVACSQVDSTVWLRVQGNGLPLNCFYGFT